MSTRAHTSVLIPLPASVVWAAIRRFDFPGRLISTVADVEMEGGASSTAIGAIRHITWKSGEKQSSRLLSVDDAFLTTRWELISSEPPAEVSAMMSTLRVINITEDETSVLDWSAEFSSDVSSSFVIFSQNAQLESLREIRGALLSNRPAFGLKDVLLTLRRGAKPTFEQLAHIWDKYDADHDGNLDVSELLNMMLDLVHEKRNNLPLRIEQQIQDLGPTSLLLGPVLLNALPMLNAALDEMESKLRTVGTTLATDLWARFDVNGDGRVTKDEFLSKASELLFEDFLGTLAAQEFAKPIQSPLPEEGVFDCRTQ